MYNKSKQADEDRTKSRELKYKRRQVSKGNKKVNLWDKYSLNEEAESFEDQRMAETLLKKFPAPFLRQKSI